MRYADGRLSVEKLYAVCLPTPARESGSHYPYDPDAGGTLSMAVKSVNGRVLTTYVWYAESIGGLWEMSRYKVVGGYAAVQPLSRVIWVSSSVGKAMEWRSCSAMPRCPVYGMDGKTLPTT